jgi:hypothetical protein
MAPACPKLKLASANAGRVQPGSGAAWTTACISFPASPAQDPTLLAVFLHGIV